MLVTLFFACFSGELAQYPFDFFICEMNRDGSTIWGEVWIFRIIEPTN